MTEIALSGLDDLQPIITEKGATHRSITAIVGPPASGKSTTAETLAERLNAADPGSAAVFPMDGYHYDDAVLHARGQRPRKGAPFTFDVAGFGHMLKRLRDNQEAEIAVPVFDRSLEISRNAARIIPNTVRHLIVEGNYLLLPEAPWSGLSAVFDETWFVDEPLDVCCQRVTARHQRVGRTAEQAQHRVATNDRLNAQLVITACRHRADRRVRLADQTSHPQ